MTVADIIKAMLAGLMWKRRGNCRTRKGRGAESEASSL
jgi:hypothetical protein